MLNDKTASDSNTIGMLFIGITLFVILMGGNNLSHPLITTIAVVGGGIGASAVIFASIILYVLPRFDIKPKPQRISKHN